MKRNHSDMTVKNGSCGWKGNTLEGFFPFTTLDVEDMEDRGYEQKHRIQFCISGSYTYLSSYFLTHLCGKLKA